MSGVVAASTNREVCSSRALEPTVVQTVREYLVADLSAQTVRCIPDMSSAPPERWLTALFGLVLALSLGLLRIF
jgi:hypothetical protein